MVGDEVLALRLLLAAGLGAILGFERELRDQPAGLRTHMLVAVGSCLFTLVSVFGFEEFLAPRPDAPVRADLTRIASHVVVGIGFLGGGTILRYGGTIRGLTTAASLWVTAAVGLAVGVGFVFAALVTVGIAIFSLAVLKPFEHRIGRSRHAGSAPPDGENG